MKNVRVILSPEAEEVYKRLNQEAERSKEARMLLKAINQKVELIKQNLHYGNPINKDLIPKEYITKYQIENLFRVELPAFWRMLYALTNGGNNIEIVSFILDIIDHKDYNKKFGYKNK
jgi:hypothetical protein